MTATISWANAVSGAWLSAPDWLPAGAPNLLTADAAITAAGTYTVTIAAGESFQVDSLTFGPGSGGTLELEGTLSLGGTRDTMIESSGTVNLAGAITGGTVTVAGGVLNDTGGAITGALVLSGGVLAIAASDTLLVSGVAALTGGEIGGPGTLATTGASSVSDLEITGGVAWVNSGTVDVGAEIDAIGTGADSITNAADGVFSLTADGYAVAQTGTASASFINAGTLVKSGGTGTSLFQVPVTSTGMVTVVTGTLELDAGGDLGGTLNGAGAFAFTTGRVTLDGGATATAALLVAGGVLAVGSASVAGSALAGTFGVSSGSLEIAAANTLSVSGAAALTGGEIGGPGTLATTGTSSVADLELTGDLAWVNSGTVTVTAEIDAIGTGADSITNAADGVFSLTADGYAVARTGTASASLSNAGTLAKTGGTGASLFQIPVTSTGVITVATGTLELDAGGDLGGTVNGTGTLAFGGGSATLDGGATVTAAALLVDGGTLAVGADVPALVLSAGSASVAASVTVGTLVLSGGVLAIAASDTLLVSGVAALTGGEIGGPGTLATTGASSVSDLEITGGVAWVNSGTVDVGAEIDAIGTGADSITNAADGVFSLTADGYAVAQTGTASASFINAGTLVKSGGTGTSLFQVPVTSTGMVTVVTGTLELDAGGDLGGTLNGAGAFAFTTGRVTLDGGATATAALLVAGGVLAVGSASVAGSALAGTFGVSSGSLEIAAANTLSVSGAAALTGGEIGGPGTLATTGTSSVADLELTGDLAWVNSGTVTVTAEIDAIGTGADSITNAADGVFSLTADGYAVARTGTASASLSNAGTLAKTGGTGASLFQIPVTSTGVITVATGTLELDAGGDLGGTVNGTGTLAFGGGSATLDGGATVTAAALLVDGGTLAVGADVPALVLSAGSASVAASVTVGTLVLSGGVLAIAASDTLLVSGVAALTGGEIGGPGTLATTGASSVSDLEITGGVAWVNSGTVDVGAEIDAIGTGADSITNAADGVFSLTADGYAVAQTGTASASFINAGTLVKSGGTGTSLFQVPVTSTGMVTVVTGTLELDAGGDLGGTLNGAGAFAFTTGRVTLDGGATATAALLVAGGVLAVGSASVAGSALAGTFGVSSGSLEIAAANTLSVSGAAALTGGEIGGPGTLATTGTSSVADLELTGDLAWVNSGTVTVTAEIDAIGTGADSITNAADGVFSLTADGYAVARTGTASASLSNAGTLAKTGGTGASLFQIPVTSTGVITVATGTLELDAGGDLGGTVNGTGTLAFGGGSATLDGGATVTAAALLVDGGTLAVGADVPALVLSAGSASVAASVTVGTLVLSGGVLAIAAGETLSVSGPITATGGGTLKLDSGSAFAGTIPSAGINVINNSSLGSGVQLLKGGSLVNGESGSANAIISGGTYGVQFDNGAGMLTNGGTITGATGVVFGDATSSGTLSNSGAITGVAGAAVSFSGANDVKFSNAGTIVGTAGVLVDANSSYGTLANSGTIQGASGVAVSFGSTNDVSLTNVGVITGTTGVVFDSNTSNGTLTNSGTITGTGGAAVTFSGTNATLINSTGSIVGTVEVDQGANLTIPEQIATPVNFNIAGSPSIAAASTITFATMTGAPVTVTLPEASSGGGGIVELADPSSSVDNNPQVGGLGDGDTDNAIEISGGGDDGAQIESGDGGSGPEPSGLPPGAGPAPLSTIVVTNGGAIVARIPLADDLTQHHRVNITHPSADKTLLTVSVSCFAAGTRILTTSGEVAVERLRPGTLLPTAVGEKPQPVVWVGHRRINARRHPRPSDVWPVRVRAGALSYGQPNRDLLLSPDHAVFLWGKLIPVRCLVNGATLLQEPVNMITYFHVELPDHSAIFADGLPVESYLDLGNRSNFDNGGHLVTLHADFARRIWNEKACAELILGGDVLVAARQRLLTQAHLLGFRLTDEPDLRLEVDGRTFSPEPVGRGWRFRFPPGGRSARLRSRTHVPAHTDPNSNDNRILGIAVQKMLLDRVPLRCTDSRLADGWRAPEQNYRWTDGGGQITLHGEQELIVQAVRTGRYWIGPDRLESRPKAKQKTRAC